ncbi:HAD-IA family hydrolase [Streptomyces spinoverrucosus]|uniref:HAD family hydrolase n=1 Tax=Streptomyces spinoverrucosus TaxID=284043 RepID=UPI0018C40184|nr:HAD-IA family hydrolase [Streptomyces spinoverrucosus]MBG0854274.1 HAD-IA family hydrolase [Streptomyces spinoverrucosus]
MGDALDQRARLTELLRGTRAVLLDFDGPVTDLFGDASTAPVADEIKDLARAIWGALDPDVEACEDSHGILRRLRDMYDRPAPAPRSRTALDRAEAVVTRFEYEAVRSARPTQNIGELVDALVNLKLPLVIVSNNAEGPVWEFLKSVGLQSKFADVVGRDPHELLHMKPHPSSVNRALRHLRVPPPACLLVGDQITDLQAAHAAGTRFLGYTPSPARAAEMAARRADGVISSHQPLIDAAEALIATN